MLSKNEKKMLENMSQAIVKLSDVVGQVIDCLKENNIKFNYIEGKLLDEKKND